MRTPVRSRLRRAAATAVIAGAIFAGGVATAPAASAAGVEYVSVTGNTQVECVIKRLDKINQLYKLGYDVSPGGCAQLLNKWIVKIAYWKK
ncbi:hypothetical protein [Plantibacter sp. YIM 135249]|uniref:hypothetical protein n=1 Tax=Plantibacter sp. YIM 135249 TaxID=3423918 RepID=UPI003D325FEB